MNTNLSPAPTPFNEPVDEHPLDPDRDFNERDENYLHAVIQRLTTQHWSTVALRLRARDEIAAAEAAERASWQSFESYLLKAALWHQKQTGQSQLRTPHGILNLFETPSPIEVTDPAALAQWVQTQLTALLRLSVVALRPQNSLQLPPEEVEVPLPEERRSDPTIPAPSVTPSTMPVAAVPPDPEWPWEEGSVDRAFIGARRLEGSPLEQAVAAFHATTGILPAGCQGGVPRTVVRLG